MLLELNIFKFGFYNLVKSTYSEETDFKASVKDSYKDLIIWSFGSFYDKGGDVVKVGEYNKGKPVVLEFGVYWLTIDLLR